MKQGLRLRKLRKAQHGICAGCGEWVPFKSALDDPLEATFDHVIPRSQGGTFAYANGLLKHRKCNVERGHRSATGCDLIWQMVVAARLTHQRRRAARRAMA